MALTWRGPLTKADNAVMGQLPGWRFGGTPATPAVAFGGNAEPTVALLDDELMAQVPAHDEVAQAALATLHDRYAAAVYGLGLRMLGDGGLAEDLLQETFWRVWLHATQYQPGRVRFGTWLLRVASNLAITELRRAARRPRLSPRGTRSLMLAGSTSGEPEDAPDPQANVPDQVWQAEQRRTVAAGLERLPPAQRQAVQLAYFGGLTHAEIAATQGAPLSTVKTRLSLGLRKLAEYLIAHGLTARDGPT